MGESTVPVFLDLGYQEQIVELRQYFRSLGVDISVEPSPQGLTDDLRQIIDICDACFNHGTESEIESVINGIVSILVLMPSNVDHLILTLSDKIANTKIANTTLKILWVLFRSINEKSPMRYHVYIHLIKIAKETNQVRAVFHGLDTMKRWFVNCPSTPEQMQRLLRLLHEALVHSKESELAAKVMVELLGTYTAENASQAKEDAQRCILAAIADPETFLLDPLLALKPVKSLEKQLVYELLIIFVSGKLSDYLNFYNKNKDFIIKSNLSHDANLKKMRLLTFMQLAEGVSEMSFNTITTELHIDESEVESFVIDLLKTKLVRGRMDQSTKKVHISSTMHRTFGPAQWEQLRHTLKTWKENLATVQEGMDHVVLAQLEMAQRAKQPIRNVSK